MATVRFPIGDPQTERAIRELSQSIDGLRSDVVEIANDVAALLPGTSIYDVTAAATITIHPLRAAIQRWTAGQNETVNCATVPPFPAAGEILTLLITNDGTAGRTITFGTGFNPSGTIVGTVNLTASIRWISDGEEFWEISRTLGM